MLPGPTKRDRPQQSQKLGVESAAMRSVRECTEFATRVLGEKILDSLHIFLASKVNIRILHDANSLQACG
jgi:hypothetical protein